MESSAKTFALFLSLESICISLTAAINECLAHLPLRIIIISGDIAIARTGIDRRVTNRAPRDRFDRWDRCDSNIRNCFRRGHTFLTLLLAGFFILESILVTLASTVFEFVAGICSMIVIVLLDEAVAGTDNFGQDAKICRKEIRLY